MANLTEGTLRDLVEAGAVRNVSVAAQGEGWVVLAEVGTRWKPVHNTRGRVKEWKSLDSLAGFLRDKLGVVRWSVEASQYAPAQRSAI